MSEKQNTDQMLEDFLQDNHVEDKDFTHKVMNSLPQQPRLVWITNIYPVMGVLLGLIAIWKLDVFNPQKLMIWGAQLLVLWNTHVGLSITVSATGLFGLGALIAFFTSEKLKDF